jgi:hypothetical protein
MNHGRRQRHPDKYTAAIYFAQCQDENGYIKIGYTKDVNARIASFQCGCPYPIVLIAWFTSDDAKNVEATLLERFKHLRVRCEWFRPELELLDAIAQIGSVKSASSRVAAALGYAGG